MMRPMLLGIFGAALLSVGLSPAQAGQVQATFDPTTAGLAGTAFSADALTGGEVSRISNGPFYADGSFDWQEIGYLNITGTIVNGAAVTPTGLGSTYTLYVTFTLNGHQPSMTSP